MDACKRLQRTKVNQNKNDAIKKIYSITLPGYRIRIMLQYSTIDDPYEDINITNITEHNSYFRRPILETWGSNNRRWNVSTNI